MSSIKSSYGSVAGLRFGPSVCSTQFQRGQIQYFKGEYKSENLNICSLTLESGAFGAKRLCDFLIKLNLLKTKSKKRSQFNTLAVWLLFCLFNLFLCKIMFQSNLDLLSNSVLHGLFHLKHLSEMY